MPQELRNETNPGAGWPCSDTARSVTEPPDAEVSRLTQRWIAGAWGARQTKSVGGVAMPLNLRST